VNLHTGYKGSSVRKKKDEKTDAGERPRNMNMILEIASLKHVALQETENKRDKWNISRQR
jgi:hypothetical protein